MRLFHIKKGQLVGFHQAPAAHDYVEVSGDRKEVESYIKDEGFKHSDLYSVTGNCAPIDHVYGRAYNKE